MNSKNAFERSRTILNFKRPPRTIVEQQERQGLTRGETIHRDAASLSVVELQNADGWHRAKPCGTLNAFIGLIKTDK